MAHDPAPWLSHSPRLGFSAPALLLTLATGAVDAISFMALGGVFTSVMTANLALLGLSVGSAEPSLAEHAALAIVGYICGVLLGSRIAVRRTGSRWTGARWALLAEAALMGGAAAAWLALDGSPHSGARFVLLVAVSVAMGVQGGVVRAAGTAGLSTTYMTGTLTGALTTLMTTGRLQRHSAVLITMLLAGAALGGLLVAHARPAALMVPTALVAGALIRSFASTAP